MDRTSALKVIVDESLLARVPGYVLGLIAVPVVDVAAAAAEVDDLLTAAEDAVHGLSLGKAEVSALPPVAAWRDAYRSVDVNPNRFPARRNRCCGGWPRATGCRGSTPW